MPWVPGSITEAREKASVAKQIRLQCPHCRGFAYANIPWDATLVRRQQEIHDAINEHRVVCTAADATEGRVYEIQYPRA